MSDQAPQTYAGSGVNYAQMDPFKRLAQQVAAKTGHNAERFGIIEDSSSRGESVFLMEHGDHYLAHVEEGLGTKNLIADAMYNLTGKSYYDQIAQDTVAMIVNDMATLGAMPISIAMHLATGSSDWFDDTKRAQDLVHGWANACHTARAIWGGGETPTLKDIIVPGTAELNGSAVGIITPKERRLVASNIRPSDQIVLLWSSGVHANGLTLCRKIAEGLNDGYLTRIDGGRTYGEALLDPTHIYVPVIDDCLDNNIELHYAVNITGHGWRKLMRANEPFTYVINELPKQLPIFDFIQEHGSIEDREMYGNYNMGAGFALFVPDSSVSDLMYILHRYQEADWFGANVAGHIEKGPKRVIIKPKNVTFEGDELAVR